MGNRGRLIAPGGLPDELAAEPGDDTALAGDGEPLAALAVRHGLRPSSARPTLASYLRKVWERRHFIVAYATARNVSMYTEARLGQLWQVLTPLLNSAVYYLIFGVLFKANRGISNYTAYLAELARLAGGRRDGRRLCGAGRRLRGLVPLLVGVVHAEPVLGVLPVGPGVLVRRLRCHQAARQRAGHLPVRDAVQPDAAR